MRIIVVTAATAGELSLLVGMDGVCQRPVKGLQGVYEWETGDKKVVFSVSGVGKANAAAAAATLIAEYSPGLLINTGCAGAYRGSGLTVGELAVASAEIYGEEGVLTPTGWQPLDCVGFPLAEKNGKRYFNEIPLSQPAVEKALRFAALNRIPLRAGKFVTVSTCSGTALRGDELSGRFAAVCENMEGAAVAHVALLHGLDCLELRGISNMVEDRDLSRWDVVRAVEMTQRFVHGFIQWL